MTLNMNVLLQVLFVLAQLLIPTLPVPTEWRQFVTAVPAAAQAAVGILAHHYNTNGKPQKEPGGK